MNYLEKGLMILVICDPKFQALAFLELRVTLHFFFIFNQHGGSSAEATNHRNPLKIWHFWAVTATATRATWTKRQYTFPSDLH